MRNYHYVGPAELMHTRGTLPHRMQVTSRQDVLQWIKDTGQTLDADKTTTATFIIDLNELLWIADRNSEHVHCARGEVVLSAGEMTFQIVNGHIKVVAVTNQSTGYCPEPESWVHVKARLDRAQLFHPNFFTTEFLFRRCDECRTINLIKDGWFECSVCGSPLPERWNFSGVSVEESECDDIVVAAQSSTGFWDNPLDNEEWNNA